jgi:hypothetical protein
VSDRLEQLRRERRLIAEHLQWLDREIAAEQGAVPQAAQEIPSPDPRQEEADVIARYAPSPQAAAASARRGCLLYAGIVLFVTLASLVAWGLTTWMKRHAG